MAAVLYVFRTLVDKDIPLNAGCLEPLTLLRRWLGVRTFPGPTK